MDDSIGKNNTSEIVTAKVAHFLSKHTGPAITQYELARLVYQSLADSNNNAHSAKQQFVAVTNLLEQFQLIRPIEPLPQTRGYQLFGRDRCAPGELACSLDPFAYVSHLSAMEYHGLTDRFTQLLYITRPRSGDWSALANAKMERDLGEAKETFIKLGYPRLVRPTFNKLSGATVNQLERSHLGAYKTISSTGLRVATIGRVFLDMIREPALCGGLQHVVDIYANNAKKYLPLIVDEINAHGAPIDKVRAGFLLTEVCKLKHAVFTSWEQFAQRGGSRKLDPEGEFESNYSDRWKLSINLPSLLNDEGTFE